MARKTSVLALLLAGCVTLAPPEVRSLSSVEPTTISKDEAYDRALVWFAKNLTNANWAVQIRDKEGGRIVANIRVSCNAMSISQTIVGNQNFVEFSADFTAKDKKFRIIFDNIAYSVYNPRYASNTIQGPQDQEDVQDIDQKCLTPIRESLVAAVKGTASNTPRSDF